jgi:hypothetical protein
MRSLRSNYQHTRDFFVRSGATANGEKLILSRGNSAHIQ